MKVLIPRSEEDTKIEKPQQKKLKNDKTVTRIKKKKKTSQV